MKKHFSLIFFLMTSCLYSVVTFAQLPQLGSPSTATGASTTARFFGGASSNNGVNYGTSFAFNTPIDIDVSIQVEPAHVNTMGNLYVFIQLNGTFFQRLENGSYAPWDLTVQNLKAAFPFKTLKANEPINLVNDVAFGPAGVSNTTLAITIAYSTVAAPNQFFFNGAPLNVTIQPQQTSVSSLQLFQTNISSQIIQTNCILCHRSGGSAGGTSLLYVSSSTANSVTTNYNTLVNYIKAGKGNTLITKPQGIGHGGGVQLQPNGVELAKLQEFVNAVNAGL